MANDEIHALVGERLLLRPSWIEKNLSRQHRHAIASTTIDSLVLGIRVYFSAPRAAGDATVAHAGYAVMALFTRTPAFVCKLVGDVEEGERLGRVVVVFTP